mmetsp:Transcript_8339/g.51997  ORF Transcript_8339/g.51997 Transcript_8339/m.51997 type:complete len:84 (-) Transcript_8339:1832-2083(-)
MLRKGDFKVDWKIVMRIRPLVEVDRNAGITSTTWAFALALLEDTQSAVVPVAPLAQCMRRCLLRNRAKHLKCFTRKQRSLSPS